MLTAPRLQAHTHRIASSPLSRPIIVLFGVILEVVRPTFPFLAGLSGFCSQLLTVVIIIVLVAHSQLGSIVVVNIGHVNQRHIGISFCREIFLNIPIVKDHQATLAGSIRPTYLPCRDARRCP
jgi:hypothetical protein